MVKKYLLLFMGLFFACLYPLEALSLIHICCDGCEDAEPDMTGEIIAMNHSFHGRSLGALSVTGNAHYQEPFKPLIPGTRFADFNDLDLSLIHI